jgi:hypothetical protein
LALAFASALTNGFRDASNAIATLVATRAARPLRAVLLASVFNVLGPLDLGAVDGARADAAIKAERRLERAYRAAMGALLEIDDLREVMARRELYRRCSRIGEGAAEVAERVFYAVVKEN